MQSKAELMQQNGESEEEEARRSDEGSGRRRKFTEFECPACTAYNPHESFGHDDDVRCSYCGLGFIAVVGDEGKLKLRED